MITDEQVQAACRAYYGEDNTTNYEHYELVDMRKALEAYEASKWVKFDEYDESTYPPNSNHVIVLYHSGAVSCDGWVRGLRVWKHAGCINCVTHWQYLPKFKE